MTKSHPWLTHPSVALIVSHPRKVDTVNTFTKGKCWKFFANLEEERLPGRCWLPHSPGPFCHTTPRRECWYCNRWLKSSVQGTWAGRPHWWCSDRSLKKNLMLKAWTYFVYWVTCQRWRGHRGPLRWSYWRELELRRGSKRVAPNKRRRGSFKHCTSQYSLGWYVSGMAIYKDLEIWHSGFGGIQRWSYFLHRGHPKSRMPNYPKSWSDGRQTDKKTWRQIFRSRDRVKIFCDTPPLTCNESLKTITSHVSSFTL